MKTREKWLFEAALELEKMFLIPAGAPLPLKLSVSAGWARGSRKAIGQCFSPLAAVDGETTHVFVCPRLGADVVEVLATLLHELVHAAVGVKEKHAGRFKTVARAVGLEGKLTATYAKEGTELHRKLLEISSRLGDYPHVPLRSTGGGGELPKPPKGGAEESDGEEGEGGAGKKAKGWVRLQSPSEPKYTVVVSPKSLEEYGYPADPWGTTMVEKS